MQCNFIKRHVISSVQTYLRVYFKNFEAILVHVVLAGLQGTPGFAAVWKIDLRTGVGSIDADEWEWNAHNLGVHVVLQRWRIHICNNAVRVEVTREHMNAIMMQTERSERMSS